MNNIETEADISTYAISANRRETFTIPLVVRVKPTDLVGLKNEARAKGYKIEVKVKKEGEFSRFLRDKLGLSGGAPHD